MLNIIYSTSSHVFNPFNFVLDRKKILQWVEHYVPDAKISYLAPMQKKFKDGVLLCKLINRLDTNSVETIYTDATSSEIQLKNIDNFLAACNRYGVPEYLNFNPEDIVKEKNIGSIIFYLEALADIAQSKGQKGLV